jgi:hypothetical protein
VRACKPGNAPENEFTFAAHDFSLSKGDRLKLIGYQKAPKSTRNIFHYLQFGTEVATVWCLEIMFRVILFPCLPAAEKLRLLDREIDPISMAAADPEDDQQPLMALSGLVKKKGTRHGLWHKRFLTITGTRLSFAFLMAEFSRRTKRAKLSNSASIFLPPPRRL